MTTPITHWLENLPLIAVLRGVQPEESLAIAQVVADAGFRVLEVPLNSPRPLESIACLSVAFGDAYLIGAGTVLRVEEVARVAEAGGRLIVMPHSDVAVIRAAKRAGLYCVPGVATPTEAFAALAAGADALKLFPAEQASPAALEAWRAVLPKQIAVLPVGGIAPDNMGPWLAAGAAGFGIGAALYVPGRAASEVAARARAFADSWHAHDLARGARP